MGDHCLLLAFYLVEAAWQARRPLNSFRPDIWLASAWADSPDVITDDDIGRGKQTGTASRPFR